MGKSKVCPVCGRRKMLTEGAVRWVYQTNLPVSVIARKAGVTRQTVYRIKSGLLHRKWTRGYELDTGWAPMEDPYRDWLIEGSHP